MSVQLSVRIAKGAPPLLELVLRDLCAAAEASVAVLPEAEPNGATSLSFTVLRGADGRAGSVTFDADEPWKLAMSIGDESFRTPFAIRGADSPALRPSLVVLAAAEAGERRARMASRIVAEARRRGLGARFAVVAETQADAVRGIAPDEVFPELSWDEIRRMLTVAGWWIDPSHPDEPAPVTAAIAAAAGAPVLTARGSRLLSSGLPSVFGVEGHYPDAYCDALAGREAVAVPPQTNAAASAFLEAARRAFGS